MTYPLEPLERRIAGLRLANADSPMDYLCVRLGTHQKTIERWRHGGMSAFVADRAACSAGFQPVDIWPTWYSDALDAKRCRWCADPADAETCSNPECRRLLKNERQNDRKRLARWWARVDRYALTVDPYGGSTATLTPPSHNGPMSKSAEVA